MSGIFAMGRSSVSSEVIEASLIRNRALAINLDLMINRVGQSIAG